MPSTAPAIARVMFDGCHTPPHSAATVTIVGTAATINTPRGVRPLS